MHEPREWGMSELTFVDANILVYARDSEAALKQTTAMRCLQFLWQEHTGRTSVQVSPKPSMERCLNSRGRSSDRVDVR
jgi:hypothetical protein